MQKAKRRSPTVTVHVNLNGNGHGNGNGNGIGHHKNGTWMPGDPIENHPLASAAGAFKDDPTWDEFVQIMKDLRREELERDLKNLEDAEEEERARALGLRNAGLKSYAEGPSAGCPPSRT